MSAPDGFDLDATARAFMEHNQAQEDRARDKAAEVHPPHAKPPEEEQQRAEPGAEAEADLRGSTGGDTTTEASAPGSTDPEPPEPAIELAEDEPEAEAASEGDDDPNDPLVTLADGSEVKFSEAIRDASRVRDMVANYTRKTQELAEQRRQVEAQAQQIIPQQQQQMMQAQQLAEQLQGALQQYAPTAQQLAELEQADPGQAALYKQRRQEHQMLVQQAQQIAEQQQQQAIQARVPQERAALMQADPDFQRNFNETYAKVGAWVTSEGNLLPEEWRDVIDHRLVLIAKRAMDAAQTNQTTRRKQVRVAKKVANLPKVRPSVPKDERDTAREGYDQAIGHLQQGHQSNEDIGAAWLAFDQLGGRRK